jgi:hypothetical protein
MDGREQIDRRLSFLDSAAKEVDLNNVGVPNQPDSFFFTVLYQAKLIIIFINCNWVVTRWQWSINTYTKHETGLLLNLHPEG